MKRFVLAGILSLAFIVAPLQNVEARKPAYCKTALQGCVRDCSGSDGCIAGCGIGYFFCDGWGL